MEGVTDISMRLWFALTSAPAYSTTPFLRLTDTFPAHQLPITYAPELTTLKDLVPYQLIPQVMASNYEHVARTSEMILNHADFLELNCGCPAPTVVGHGAGSSILKDPEQFHRSIAWLCEKLGPKKLAIKIRLGFTDEKEFPDILTACQELPLAMLTIHGRTRADRYQGHARWHWIEQAAKACRYPVIGSGDVTDRTSLEQRLQIAPRVSRIIVGRGAVRNPWIFSEIENDEPVSIELGTLKQAISVLAILEDWRMTEPEGLIRFAEEGHFKKAIGTDSAGWQVLLESLSKSRFGTSWCVNEIELHRRCLGRIKMLWSSLRSSLPAAFFAPEILRQSSLKGMLEQLNQVTGFQDSNMLSVSYKQEHDWVYAGAGRPKPPPAQTPSI